MFAMSRSLAAVLAALLVAACADQDQTLLTAPEAGAPLLSSAPSTRTVPDRYIVVLKAGADAPGLAQRTARAHAGTVHYVYQHALNGFAATLPPQAVEALRHNPQVDFIEPDQVMSRDASQSPATWGLDRIDQRNRPTNNTYNYYFTGAGVHVYVIDTGVRGDHVDYSGRATDGRTSPTATAPRTAARGTEPSSPVSSEAPRTAWPRESPSIPCGSSTAHGTSSTPVSSRA